jgi:predicted ATPase
MNDQALIAGRYEMGARIGEGGMGTVYRGVDSRSREAIAIKRLKPDLVNAEMLARFTREGEALRQLNHPNIVKVLATVQDGDSHYLIMELVSGGSLSDHLQGTGSFPIERVLRIGLELSDALTRAHHLNVIHRDLKPANVLIADDGTPRLTDFGVALMTGKERITETEGIVGTLSYLSPEAFGLDGIDARADIWAFGVMLFEMLAGQRPFDRAAVTQTLMAILSDPTPDLEELRPDCPIALVDLIYRMLEKDPHQRIPSVRQVGAELENILQGRPSSTPVGVSPLQPKSPTFDTPTPSPAAIKHNLPAQTTAFVGREDELSELARLLSDANTRLVTILAPGGMGKTRLALEVGTRYISSLQHTMFSNGVFFVSLAPLTSPDFIVSTIAESVGFQFYQGGEPKQQLLDFFREKSMLLLMDNFEHVLAGASIVSEILQTAPHVKILATSRERLNLSGETLFSLSGMDFPDWETPQDALNYSAVKLFLQSAKRVRPDFELQADNLKYVARICRLVQGMPLGILLAASWVEVLSLREIADEISKSIDFLESEARDLPERHRSIRAVFDYSWNLLTDEERAALAKLSVFRGGFSREAAQAVADAGLRTLMALVNKSLLRRNPDSGRYEFHELLRQYGEQRLLPEERDLTRDLHCGYYAGHFQQLTPDLKGAKTVIAVKTAAIDYENAHLAWQWAVQHVKRAELWQLFDVFTTTVWTHNRIHEGIALSSLAVTGLENTPTSTSQDDELLGIMVAWQALICSLANFPEQFRDYAEKSLAILNRLDASTFRPITAEILSYLGMMIAENGNVSRGKALVQRSIALCRDSDYRFGLCVGLTSLCIIYVNRGEVGGLDTLIQEAEKLALEIGNPDRIGMVKVLLGETARLNGNLVQAKHLFLEGVPLLKITHNWTNLTVTQNLLGEMALGEGNLEDAKTWFTEALSVYHSIGNRWALAETLCGFAKLLIARGEKEQAVEFVTLVFANPKTNDTWAATYAKPLLASLEAELPPEVYATAIERGKALELDAVVRDLLAQTS